MNLKKKLYVWEKEKLITQKQQEKILNYEAEHTRSFGMLSFILLGVFCIGLGIISLIASNWDRVPDMIKIGGAFAFFASILGGTYYLNMQSKKNWYEAGLLLSFILCGALIGLVAQVFHLIPSGKDGAFLWAIAALPLVLCSQKKLLGFLWVPLFGYAFISDSIWEYIFRFFEGYPLLASLGGVALCGAVAYTANKISFPFLKALSVWAVIGMYMCVVAGEFSLHDVYKNTLLGFGLTMLFLGSMSYLTLKKGCMKSFNVNTLLMALRILILYFQLFMSLAITGVGLIISGALILGIIWGWKKIKNKIVTVVKGGINA